MKIHGPYQHGKRWRVVVASGEDRETLSFASQSEAESTAQTMRGRSKNLITAGLLRTAAKISKDATWVYILRSDIDGSVLYVGMTMSPGTRMADHRRGGKDGFSTWLIPAPLSRADARRVEADLIRHFEPPMNRVGLGNTFKKAFPSQIGAV